MNCPEKLSGPTIVFNLYTKSPYQNYELDVLKLSSTCISFADSSKVVQILFSYFYAVFTLRYICQKPDLYPVLWWCVRGRGRDQGFARLVLNGCGVAVPEILGAIREDSR